MLTSKQAAARLKIHESRVCEYCRSGRLKASQFGTSKRAPWMIAEADLAKFIKSRINQAGKRQRGRPPKCEAAQ